MFYPDSLIEEAKPMGSFGKFPAVDQAFNAIKRKLDEGAWHQGDRLPPIWSLARMANVSKESMAKAVARLKGSGLVSGIERHALRAGPAEAYQAVQEKLLPWQQKRMLLEKDVMASSFGPQPLLPPLKELQARYGVCFSTMKRIVAAMVRDGVLTPKGKRYGLPAVSRRAFGRKIVFITYRGHISQTSALNSEHNRIVNVFENECLRLGLHLEMEEIDFYNPAKRRQSIGKLSNMDSTVGFILDIWWYTSEDFRRAYLDALARLATFKKPVALLDEIGGFDFPIEHKANPLLQKYRIEGKRAGESMARLLLELGHRNVAYVSLLHQTLWSRERYAGIETQFSRAGFSGGVHLVADTIDVTLPCVLTASGLADKDVRRLIAVGRTESQAADLENQWLQFRRSNPFPGPGYPRIGSPLVKNIADLTAQTRKGTDDYFLRKACTGALDAAGDRLYEICLHPLFERALKLRNVTAWICATDSIAFVALTFLERRAIRVPGDISIAGFDNTPVKALERRLTSLDFNTMGFVHRILNFIIRPPRPRGRYRHETIEVEGVIIERGTVGKPGR
jgi:DNA-binding transcriptional regulator YhcF (GntR family)